MANFFYLNKGGPSLNRLYRGAIAGGVFNLLDPEKRAQGLAAFTLDPTQFTRIGSAFSQFSAPDYLDVAQNPYVRNMMDALTQAANLNLDRNLANLRSQFAAQGQTGAGAASPLALTQAQTIAQHQDALNRLIAEQLFGQFQRQQALQLQGLAGAQGYQLMPANIASMFQGLFPKKTSSAAADWGGILGGIGGLAGGLAALASLCWVAREVFGPRNPKWIKFRRWLINKAPKPLFRLYLAKGERFANWLHNHRWAKPPVRFAMNLAMAMF